MFHNSKCISMSSGSNQGSPPFHPKNKPLVSRTRSPQRPIIKAVPSSPTSGSVPLSPVSPITKLFQPLLNSSGSFQRHIVQELQSSPTNQSVPFPLCIPFFKSVPSPSERATSPPLPDGPLHTTRSDTSGSSSEDEDSTNQHPVLKPINDIRRTLLLEEKLKTREEEEASWIMADDKMSVFRQEMLPHIPKDESWIDPNYQSWIPYWDEAFTESDDGEMNAFEMEDDSFLFEDVPDDKDQQVYSSKATCNESKSKEGYVKKHLSDFVKEFEVESKKPPAIVHILSNNEKNDKVKILDDQDEVVVVIRRCMVRTTKAGIEKARRDWEEEWDNKVEFEKARRDWEQECDMVVFEDEISEIEFEEEEQFINDEEDVHGSDKGDIKMKIKKLIKKIRKEERKPLINERLVNDLRNQVNYLERKVEQLEG